MAFDMRAGDWREKIDHQSDFILGLTQGDAQRYPQLLRINAEFWDDPSISPAQSNALVHELIDLGRPTAAWPIAS